MDRISILFVKFVEIRIVRLSVFSDKSPDGTVVGSLSLRSEETAWKLFHPPVVGDTFAAPTFSVTGFISAGAPGLVLFDMAFEHINFPFL